MEESQDLRILHGIEEDFETDLSKKRRDARRQRTSLNRIRRRKSYFIALASLIVILVLAVSSLLVYTWDHQTIAKGVTISGLNVSNLTQEQAESIIEKDIKNLSAQTIKLNTGKESPTVKLSDLGLSVSGDLALQEAYDVGRKGNIFAKAESKMKASKGTDFELSPKWDEQKLKSCLNQTLKDFINPAKDASYVITSQNTMSIQSEHKGTTFDMDALIDQIKGINIYKPVSEIKVDLKDQTPQITAAQLESQKITGLLASYTTYFDPSQAARTENVRLAAKALDMAVIKPGDTLSFNKIVGERTVAGGYKDAYIIVNGQFVPGLAGGICQVSSTLYNTGLLADLQVTQRSNHDLAITYVPLGQDATVAYPNLDLKFNNNTGGYLLIRTRSTANSLTIDMYGKVKPGQEITIADTIDSTIPPQVQHLVDETLAHGTSVLKQQGQPGYVVSTVRTVKMNGKIVSTEKLQKSVYEALPKIYAVGSQSF